MGQAHKDAGSSASPRPQKRGPVEAVGFARRRSMSQSSPRPQKRGPVEASSLPLSAKRRTPSLRALKSAAPLKLATVATAGIHRVRSPRPQKRGPVEACPSCSPSCSQSSSPRPQKRGPVEAVYDFDLVRVFEIALRALKSAAPLKLRLCVLVRKVGAGSPRPQKRGPVEASGTGLSTGYAHPLSAPSKARPR